MKFVSKLAQRGVTLFEVLLVMFVAALIAVAVATLYKSVTNSVKSDTLNQGVATIVSGVHSLYSTVATGYSATNLTTTNIINSGIPPSSMVNGTAAYNPFGGDWSISGVTANSFTLTVTGLPSSACTSLGSYMIGQGITSVAANGGAATTDPGALAGQCTAAGSTNKVAIITP